MELSYDNQRFCRILNKDNGVICFEVDENLTLDDRKLYWNIPAEKLAFYHINRHGDTSDKVSLCHTSFSDSDRILYYQQDPFFQMMGRAYGCHRPVILSPDVIWLLICQGFNRYIRENAEKLRHLFVDHEDVAIITVDSVYYDPDNADWDRIVQKFAEEISKSTKADLSAVITADFTTTGTVEKVASQITLMDTVKPYFDYVYGGYICGIPSITLKGTPEDWKKVYLKAKKLAKYGVNAWIRKLSYVLKEFVSAAEGNPRKTFWKSIVKRYRPQELQRRHCGYFGGKLSSMDGWILRLFPEGQSCQIQRKVLFDSTMPPEIVSVPIKFQVSDGKNIIEQYNMDLYSGIVGLSEDDNLALEAKVGWFVCRNIEN